MVEVAVALPVLVLLFAGLLDLGRAYYYGVIMTDAARDAARMLVANTNGVGPGKTAGCSTIQAAIANMNTTATCPTTGTSPSAGQVLVRISCPDGSGTCVGPAGNQPVTVDVYYGFALLTPVISAWVPGGVITLHGHAVMDSTW